MTGGIRPDMTVNEVVALVPEAVALLGRYGIDTCCSGGVTLGRVCDVQQISFDAVARDLEAAAAAQDLVTEAMTVRDAMARYPATGAVFAAHGLMGCGGMAGPDEPIRWFAQVHHVDADALLRALNVAAASGDAPGAVQEAPGPAERLYRRFLHAALVATLTGGTALGAVALVILASRGSLEAFPRALLQAHGHVQLFGWVGLFVLGVAYHIVPRLTATSLHRPGLAALSFVLMLGGLVARAAGQPWADTLPGGIAVVAGAALELLAGALFLWVIAGTLAGAAARAFYTRYLLIGTAWLMVALVLNLVHAAVIAATGTTVAPPALNRPFLTVILLGFATFWIFGVSLRILPVFIGLKTAGAGSPLLLGALTGFVALLAAGEGLFAVGPGPIARLLLGVGGGGTAAGVLVFVHALGILRSRARETAALEPDRGYEKFVTAGYAWLVLAAIMLAALTVGAAFRGADAPHAYVGAYRHALTVGFISLLIVGMATRIVPVFTGVPLFSPRLREATFWLITVGSVIRVVFQSLYGLLGPEYLRLAGISGLLEFAGFALFAINLWGTLAAEPSAEAGHPAITPGATVGRILAAYPSLLPVFVRYGFADLANPILRRTVARAVTLEGACRRHGVDVAALIQDLEAARRTAVPGGSGASASARAPTRIPLWTDRPDSTAVR